MDDKLSSELGENELRSIVHKIMNYYQNKIGSEPPAEEEAQPSVKKQRTTARTATKPQSNTTVKTRNHFDVLTIPQGQERMEAESQATPEEDVPVKVTKLGKVVFSVKSPMMPRIIIKQMENWQQTKLLMNTNNINTIGSKLVDAGMEIEPQTEGNNKNRSNVLDNK